MFAGCWQTQAGRETCVFMTGVLGHTIMLRQELLPQCHPLAATVHRALKSGQHVDSVRYYWIDRSAERRMCCQCLWRAVATTAIDPCN